LKKSLLLYPENPQALPVRLQLADCYHQLAVTEHAKEKQLEERLASNPPTDLRNSLGELRRQARQTRLNLLDEAIQTNQGLADHLLKRSKEKPLDEYEQTLRRRALFGIGECQQARGNPIESQRVFQNLQINHRCTLEGLYAGKWVFFLVAEIPADSKAREAARKAAEKSLDMLTEDLNTMPATHKLFEDPIVRPRSEWLSWVEAMRRTLSKAPNADPPLPAIR
jgi:hypothetical protein